MSHLVCNESSIKAVEFFKANAADFGPIKKFTTFFDSENFLLTEYTPTHEHIQAIIENTAGQRMEFSNLNCGYGGLGPSATADILQMVGVSSARSEKLKLYDGIQIEFDASKSDGIDSVFTQVFFRGSVKNRPYGYDGGCNLNGWNVCNTITRDVYMVNPETHNFSGLLNCLHVMEPFSFEYNTDGRSDFMNFRDISKFPFRGDVFPAGTDGVNLIIRGKKFNLCCLIDRNYLWGTLNAVYLYLTKTPLFSEENLRGVTVLRLWNEPKLSALSDFFLSLFKRPAKGDYCSLKVSDEELMRNE